MCIVGLVSAARQISQSPSVPLVMPSAIVIEGMNIEKAGPALPMSSPNATGADGGRSRVVPEACCEDIAALIMGIIPVMGERRDGRIG